MKNEATDLLDNKGPGFARIGNEATVGRGKRQSAEGGYGAGSQQQGDGIGRKAREVRKLTVDG
ncbi:MAG: hypothetical protein ACLQOO_33210 [Terriglobia bacterium]